MNCLRPILLDNPEFGQPYDIYRTRKISVPCGHCPCCIVNSANEWRTRLEIENDVSISSHFCTLTYDDANLPLCSCSLPDGTSSTLPCVSKRDVQLFLKRLRKRFSQYRLRYFFVSEYGPTTLRPHYHGILFGLPRLHPDDLCNQSAIAKEIHGCWSNGHVRVDPVTFGRIAYVTKYLSCVTDLPPYLPKPFRLMSRNPGIGSTYMENKSVVDWHRENLACYYPDGRFKRRLPRYLKDKLFDDAMKIEIREQIQKSKQDEQDIASRARNCGYNNRYDFIIDSNRKFKRKFDKQMKKSRKDI